MITIVTFINIPFNFLFDWISLGLSFLSPFWSLAVISLLTGWLMLWIFGKTSKQKKIKTIKNRIRGHFLAIRLFSEHLGVFFRIQGRILADTLSYMKYSLIPLLVMIVPVVLIMVQLHQHYAARPLNIGERTVVKATISNLSAVRGDVPVELIASDGVRVDTPPIHIPALDEVAWRIVAEKAGRHHLTLKIGDHQVDKEVVVEGSRSNVKMRRTGANWFDLLLYPGEPPIDSSSGIQAIEIDYPERTISFLGFKMNWLIQFLVLSILFGFMSKGLFGVEV